MKTVLLTGRNGFIGSRLAAELKERHRVVSVIRHKKADIDYSGEEIIFSSVSGLNAEEITAQAVDLVVHLAAMVRGEAGSIEQNNIESSRHLFQMCESLKVPVLFLSSANAIYFNQLGSYAYSKKVCEDILRTSRLSFLIVRVPWVIGPKSPLVLSAQRFYRRLGFFPLLGPSLGQIQPVPIASFVQTICDMINSAQFPGSTVHIIGKTTYQYREILEKVLDSSKTRFLLMPYKFSLGLAVLFEKIRVPFFVSSEEIKSVNMDKRVDETYGDRVILENNEELLFKGIIS